jgi:hypothetical protein
VCHRHARARAVRVPLLLLQEACPRTWPASRIAEVLMGWHTTRTHWSALCVLHTVLNALAPLQDHVSSASPRERTLFLCHIPLLFDVAVNIIACGMAVQPAVAALRAAFADVGSERFDAPLLLQTVVAIEIALGQFCARVRVRVCVGTPLRQRFQGAGVLSPCGCRRRRATADRDACACAKHAVACTRPSCRRRVTKGKAACAVRPSLR